VKGCKAMNLVVSIGPRSNDPDAFFVLPYREPFVLKKLEAGEKTFFQDASAKDRYETSFLHPPSSFRPYAPCQDSSFFAF